MAGEKFKLNFITNGEGEIYINEPSGFDSADFNLNQKDKGYGRDVNFAGGETEFTFYRMNNHQFDLLLYYKRTYGWESEVKLIIEKDGVSDVIGDLDFFTLETDDLEYIKVKVIQENNQALVKRRSDINVDLFASEDLDGNAITPINTYNVLLKSKSIAQESKWETPSIYNTTITTLTRQFVTVYANPAISLVKSDISDSLISIADTESLFFFGISESELSAARNAKADNFKVVQAFNNLYDVVVDITDLNLLITKIFATTGTIGFDLQVRWGNSISDSQVEYVVAKNNFGDSYSNTGDYKVNIPLLNRGQSIWIYFYISFPDSCQYNFVVNSMDVSISVASKSYNTVVPAVKLFDACEKTVEAISGLGINFPLADVGGVMENQMLFNGNTLRGLIDKPFNLSLKQIGEWLPEINGDYEVGSDDIVFFGTYPEFYTNTECGVFTDIPFSSYNQKFNERYAINEFNFKYKKYQSKKEKEVDNTFDIVHGESQWLLQNKFVENKKEIDVEFVRDAFMIGEQQRKSLEVSETTSTQDDDTIYIIDTVYNSSGQVIEEIDLLQHEYQPDTGYLKLSNTGNFSFSLLGLKLNTIFYIAPPNNNSGFYRVVEAYNNYVILNPFTDVTLGLVGGVPSASTNGEFNTTFTYVIGLAEAPYIIKTGSDLISTNNIISAEDYGNLQNSIKQNIRNYWNEYLDTANFFAQKEIKNTKYNNNLLASIKTSTTETVEANAFLPSDGTASSKILAPNIHEVQLITNFTKYKTLENSIRVNRGFVRVTDNQGYVLRLYPTKMKFVNNGDNGELTITGEEKFADKNIYITSTFINENVYVIDINGEYKTNYLYFEENDLKISIFDSSKRLLYTPVYWNQISINDAIASTKEELIEWLTLLL